MHEYILFYKWAHKVWTYFMSILNWSCCKVHQRSSLSILKSSELSFNDINTKKCSIVLNNIRDIVLRWNKCFCLMCRCSGASHYHTCCRGGGIWHAFKKDNIYFIYLIRSFMVQFWWLLLLYLTQIFLCAVVPDDVFAPNFLWKGSYDYKGQKQPLTLTVSSFNATSGKVNATLADTSVEFLLSGETCINTLSLACIYFEKVFFLCIGQLPNHPMHQSVN